MHTLDYFYLSRKRDEHYMSDSSETRKKNTIVHLFECPPLLEALIAFPGSGSLTALKVDYTMDVRYLSLRRERHRISVCLLQEV